LHAAARGFRASQSPKGHDEEKTLQGGKRVGSMSRS
jgi:hypothetical protein